MDQSLPSFACKRDYTRSMQTAPTININTITAFIIISKSFNHSYGLGNQNRKCVFVVAVLWAIIDEPNMIGSCWLVCEANAFCCGKIPVLAQIG